jgi:membrane protease YdiL (CAAX protease family)
MELAFRRLSAAFGPKVGYFAAFSVYWSGWCLAVLLWTVGGWEGVRALFGESQERLGRRPLLGACLLAWPPLLAGGAVFVRQVARSSPAVILSSLGLALVNATGEELLWRGAYLRAFPESKALGWKYPAAGFGVWHLAPQAVHPNTRPGGAWSLTAVSLAGGLGYGWIAWTTRSIRWTTAFHILWDFLGLGGRIYLA